MQTEVQLIWNISNVILGRKPWSEPLAGLRVWNRGLNSTYSKYGQVGYQSKRNDACSNMVTNIFTRRPNPPPLTLGQNLTFSEHGHVAYQFKWNHEWSNMVANILPADPPPYDPWVVSKPTFSYYGHVAYQIKGNDACSNMWSIYFARRPTPTLEVGSKGQYSTFSEQGHVAYQIKWNHECSNMVANTCPQAANHCAFFWAWERA